MAVRIRLGYIAWCMRLSLYPAICLVGLAWTSSAAAESKWMIGAQGIVSAEAEEGNDTVLGINILPIVVEYATSTRLGVRLNSIVNLRVQGSDRDLAERGLGLTMPVYLSKTSPDGRTFLGPHLNYTRSAYEDRQALTAAAEFGVRWPIADSISLNLEIQLGLARVFGNEVDEWDTHIGIYPGLGYWL